MAPSAKSTWGYQYSLQCAKERNGGKLPSKYYLKTVPQLHNILLRMTDGKHKMNSVPKKKQLVDQILRLEAKPARDAAAALVRAEKLAAKEAEKAAKAAEKAAAKQAQHDAIIAAAAAKFAARAADQDLLPTKAKRAYKPRAPKISKEVVPAADSSHAIATAIDVDNDNDVVVDIAVAMETVVGVKRAACDESNEAPAAKKIADFDVIM